jgi:hypothetical protein
MATRKNPTDRKIIQIKKLRIPLVKLLNGKDIRTAAKNLEDFRLKMKEEEILLGATLTVKYDNWNSDFNLIATRPETDNEMNDRLEKARLALEAKQRREAERKATEAARKEKDRIDRLHKTKEQLIKMAYEAGIAREHLVDFLNS